MFENTEIPKYSFDETSSIIPVPHYLSTLSQEFCIYVNELKDDTIINALDEIVTPGVKEIIEESFVEADKRTSQKLKPLYNELVTKFDLDPKEMVLRKAMAYVDFWEMSRKHGKQLSKELSDEAKQLVPKFLRDYFYEGYYGSPEIVKISSSSFFKFLVTVLNGKVKAYENPLDESNPYQDIKYMLLSGHDITITAYLSALGHK